jgi:hypothetical protein
MAVAVVRARGISILAVHGESWLKEEEQENTGTHWLLSLANAGSSLLSNKDISTNYNPVYHSSD